VKIIVLTDQYRTLI